MQSRPLPLLLGIPLAAAGGWLTDLAFPDRAWWALAFIGIALLYLAVRGRGVPSSLVIGLAWGLAFFLPHIAWADFAVGAVPWVALSTAQALMVGLGCAAWSFVARWGLVAHSEYLEPVAFAFVWTAMEILRSAAPFGGFPWGRLAFSQADSPVGRFAWVGGPTLVTFLVVVVGVTLALGLRHLARLRVGVAAGTVVVAFAVVCAGWAVPLAANSEDGYLRVGAVQGNVAEPGLGAFANRYEVLRNHVDGTHRLLDVVEPGELDIVLWPENSSDVDPRRDADAAEWIDEAARAVDAPILVGTQEYPASGGRYNQGALWVPGEGIVQVYAKQHPAPFAEYVPMRDFARRFSSAVDLVTHDMLPGTGAGVLDLEVPRLERTVRIGDVICFEVAYDDVVRSSIREGGELLVVQTNNANFGYTNESTQQLAMARIRAIETGRATVQISTVGVSAVIAPNGVVREQTGLFTAENIVADLPLRTSLTPAVRAGEIPNWIVCTVAVVGLLGGIVGAGSARRRGRGGGS